MEGEDCLPLSSPPKVSIAIIGAGLSGICAGIKLKQEFGDELSSFTIFEKKVEVGGTWRDNCYPGAACDVPSHCYSFSFQLNPDWSRPYSPQREILSYITSTIKKNNLSPHLQLGTEVVAASWDEKSSFWRLKTRRTRKGIEREGKKEAEVVVEEEEVIADFVISGVGQFHQPFIPRIPGIEQFRGKMFHSATWDSNYDLTGKDVAVIGTGASSVQIVPAIAPLVKSLKLYQRTPNWILSRDSNSPFSKPTKWIFSNVPFAQKAYRNFLFLSMEVAFGVFQNDSSLSRLGRTLCLSHISRTISDSKLRELVTPKYPFGCRRILISTEFYPALQRPNVSLITDSIKNITTNGIQTSSSLDEVDCIVLATGFQVTKFLSPLKIFGRHGLSLEEKWTSRKEAFRGLAVSGFPNFFLLYGPNTNTEHHSVIFNVECQVNYVAQLLHSKLLFELENPTSYSSSSSHPSPASVPPKRLSSIEVRPEVERKYNQSLEEDLMKTVWAQNTCRKQGREKGDDITSETLITNWTGTGIGYWTSTMKPRLEDFEIRDEKGTVLPTSEVERPLKKRKGAERMLSFLKWFELNHSPLGEGCFYPSTTSPSFTTSLLPFFRFAE